MRPNNLSVVVAPLMATWLTLLLDTATVARATSSVEAARCPPQYNVNSTTIVEMVYYSHVLVLAQVFRTYPEVVPGTGTPQGGEQLEDSPAKSYTAELEISCVYYKDGSLDEVAVPQKINVTHAGVSADSCFRTEYRYGNGSRVLAFLVKHEDGYTSSYPPQPDGYLDEVTVICNISATLPTGVSKDKAEQTCMTSAAYDDDEYDDEDVAEGEESNGGCLQAFDPRKPQSSDDLGPASTGQQSTYNHVPLRSGSIVDQTEVREAASVDEDDDDDADDGDDSGSASLRMSAMPFIALLLVLISFS